MNMVNRVIYTLNTLTIRGRQNMNSVRIVLKALRSYLEDNDQSLLQIAFNNMEKISVIGESDISALLGCIEAIEEILIPKESEETSNDNNNE